MTVCFIWDATLEDAAALTVLINRIILIGGATAHLSHFDAQRMQDIYIKPALGISCLIAESEGHIVGFQSLEWSDPECAGADRIGTDWAFIASFVAPDNHDKGIGKRLFEHTKQRALFASVNTIDATIGAVNDSGLRYYTRLGFIDHDRINASPLSDGTLIDRIRKKMHLLP